MAEFGYLPVEKPDTSAEERYTLPWLLDWCQRKAGVTAWDLDVAACAEAHCAPRWYDREANGLVQPWNAHRVFWNPPWTNLAGWCRQAWTQFDAGAYAIGGAILPGNRQDQPWWQEYIEPFRDNGNGLLRSFYPPKRQPFGVPGNVKGEGLSGVPHPVVFLAWTRWPHG